MIIPETSVLTISSPYNTFPPPVELRTNRGRNASLTQQEYIQSASYISGTGVFEVTAVNPNPSILPSQNDEVFFIFPNSVAGVSATNIVATSVVLNGVEILDTLTTYLFFIGPNSWRVYRKNDPNPVSEAGDTYTVTIALGEYLITDYSHPSLGDPMQLIIGDTAVSLPASLGRQGLVAGGLDGTNILISNPSTGVGGFVNYIDLNNLTRHDHDVDLRYGADRIPVSTVDRGLSLVGGETGGFVKLIHSDTPLRSSANYIAASSGNETIWYTANHVTRPFLPSSIAGNYALRSTISALSPRVSYIYLS